MNFNKTKVMFNKQVMPRPISVDGTLLEVVQDYLCQPDYTTGPKNFLKEADKRIRRNRDTDVGISPQI
ncbi:unnamed protein product [Euphydryas editha]|uniref:Uncharacterized protein n=1 Tax=Euphydryas editha TaxID=104508 RepID=A0AAU9TGZ1_EUPED|nr:unnamed protein product [Euphydryas editha]